MDWTTPADLRLQLQRHWDSGRILAARLNGEVLFPLRLRFKKPDVTALSERFDEVRKWIGSLEAGSKTGQAFGYEIEWTEINHRRLGRNRIPTGVLVATEHDALGLIGKKDQAERLTCLARASVKTFPLLAQWFARKPLTALEYADDWDRILSVLAWFAGHPSSGFYLRQLDIPGVDTKFIETRKGLLSELLDQLLPSEADPQQERAKSFEQRYGLCSKPPLIRFRILDERISVQCFTDMSVPASQFARLALPVERVFITENEINGLCFPQVPRSLVVFGLGYGVQLLSDIPWLREKELHYWGDLDTHGFAILDRLRAGFPDARSFLMDRETLIAHRQLWGREEGPYTGTLSRLTAVEHALFDELKHDCLGHRIRLEQERISFGWFERALQWLAG